MSKSNAHESAILALEFNGTSIAGLAVDDTGTPDTEVDIALHTADPGEAGSATTSEATYTGYARATTDRASGAGGWTVASGSAENASEIVFDPCTAGSNTITHFSAVRPGTDTIRRYGELTAPLEVSAGITPRFAAGTLVFTED